ncbi:MAG: Sec-independent protein translocase protein TatB [Gammaproteobacteria bacterium]|nr:Sec-independent protein translocase protein TatB [Gammaproteobacteria bacterium]
MSGIGFWELIILFLIGLIVLGPERLPRVANQLGSWLGQARRMTRVMRRQLEEEIDFGSDLKIKPDADKSKPSFTQPEYVSRNDNDDTYSPAHDDESDGTGVDDDKDYPDFSETDVMPADDERFRETDVLPRSEAVIATEGAEAETVVTDSSAKEKPA